MRLGESARSKHVLAVALLFRRRALTLIVPTAVGIVGATGWLTAVRSTPILALVEVGAFFWRRQLDLPDSG